VEVPAQRDRAAPHQSSRAASVSVERTARRRRPSGEPPPLPRHIRRSGKGWLVAGLVLVAMTITLFWGESRGPALAVTAADDAVVRWLSGLSFPGYRGVMRGLAGIAAVPLITAIDWGIVLALLALRRLRHLVVWAVAWTVGALVYNMVVTATQRPRPFGVPIRAGWYGWAMPSLPLTALSATVVAILYTLVPEGRWRNLGKWVGAGLVTLAALGRIALGAEAPTDALVGVAIGVTIPLVAFRLFTPSEVFPVTYRRGRAAHLDVTGERGTAIRRAVEDQLGLVVDDLAPFGLAGSAGSTPLRIRIKGDPSPVLFGKLYAETHLRADRWYKLGRELLYGRLEDEKPFHSVRRLVQQEDYALRLFRDQGLPTPTPHGVVELTPEREYLLLTEFLDGAVELGDAEVDDEIIDSGLEIIRRLWDTGLAHRDIKPSNLLVRDHRILLIDVAFAELRPTPWRQAVDLANMMLCLALRSSAERVYERALRQFTVADIGEAFAAARGLALPSQLRGALRAQGRDVHGEFIRLLPATPRPVRIQRWNARRMALWALVLVAIGAAVGSRDAFALNDTDATDLRTQSLGCEQQPSPLWLQAQAVPSASLIPCVQWLPAGWQFAGAYAKSGWSVLTFDHDRAHAELLVARFEASCDVGGATEVLPPDTRVRRFQRGDRTTGEATWYDVFPGGCVTVRMQSHTTRQDVNAQVGIEAPQILGFESRQSLQQALAERSGGRLHLDPAPSP